MALAGIVLGHYQIVEPDVFWHLKTGQVILETGRLVKTNLFSSTYPEYIWHNLEWLHQVTLAGAFNLGGWAGVAAFKTVMVLLTALVFYLLLLSRACGPLLAASLTVATLALMRFRISERPHLFSFLFLALTMLAADQIRRGRGRVIWALPLLYVLWSNTHPELILGLVYLGGAAFGEWLNGPRDGRRQRATARLLAALSLSAAATLANPEGFRPLVAPFLGDFQSIIEISEFAPSSWSNAPFFWVWVGVGVLAVAFGRNRRDWADIVPALAFGILGAVYIRANTAFALAVMPVILPPVAEGWTREQKFVRRLPAMFAMVLAGATFAWSMSYSREQPYRWGLGPDERIFPVAAADFLQRRDLPGILYNHYDQGGYLIFRLYPRIRVFQDSRFQPYPMDFSRRLHGGHTGANWASLFDDYGVNSALVRTEEAGTLFPAVRWGVVYWDPGFALLVRRVPANQAVLDALEYRLFLPGSAPGGEGMAELTALAVEMRRNNAERREPSPVVARELGIVLGRLRRYQEASDALEQAVALAPQDADAWAYLGRAREMTGRRDASREAYRRALGLDPGNQQAARWLNP